MSTDGDAGPTAAKRGGVAQAGDVPGRAGGLDLAVIGNSRVGALVDTEASIVWMCVPRFDGDPVFCALLDRNSPHGRFDIALEAGAVVEQAYERNSPILRSVLRGADGSALEVIDFAPRYYQNERIYSPVSIVRILRRLSGRPRVRVRYAPRCNFGAETPQIAYGSHHIRAQVPAYPLRLTTDAPITMLVEGRPLLVENSFTFILGPDETLSSSPREAGRHFYEETQRYWQRWVRNLAIPFEWQDAVIRAAITLKLNACDDTGGIVAALTTSVPEAPHTPRNWDYRYCWLRDAYFVVNALNRLGATGSLERYLHYIEGIVAEAGEAVLQPVYSISGATDLTEFAVPGLAGYRGMGPVRIGNLAWQQRQNDVYGSAILAVSHAFFDQRLTRPGDITLFRQLERLGLRAYEVHAQPDAGLWEFRGRQSVHTFSAVMCWAACDRLARIARQLGVEDAVAPWRARAEEIRKVIDARGWNATIGAYVNDFGGNAFDASSLLLGELGYLTPGDPRLRATVEAVERQLRRGDFLLRYDRPDDFGAPETAFLVCTFWWIQALALLGERDRAREEFERLLRCRNRFGLLSEDIDFRSGELWGNFPQTYSMVGIISCAMRLSTRWDDAF